MPKTIPQRIVFTVIMAFVMVYAMICYNISINIGGMSNQVFLLAFKELIIMLPVAFILEFFIIEKAVQKVAFNIVSPNDKPLFIVLTISAITVCFMCPIMSLVATVLFKNAGIEFFAVWVQTTIKNFPMALMWQIFFAGPVVRAIFGSIFKKANN